MKKESFHKVTKNLPPSPFLKKTLELPEVIKGNALELGCGSGRDTIELVNQGWNVTTIDKSEEGITNLNKLITDNAKVVCKIESFEEMDLPTDTFDLVYSRLSLSFCQKDSWNNVWSKIESSLKKGGIISMHLFGENDGFKDSKHYGNMTFFSKKSVKDLLVNFDIIFNNEEEDYKKPAVGQMKHWHIFTIAAKKV